MFRVFRVQGLLMYLVAGFHTDAFHRSLVSGYKKVQTVTENKEERNEQDRLYETPVFNPDLPQHPRQH